jgi:L-ascorbate metabolism protein UlaG (beta-lactamase superfamily)
MEADRRLKIKWLGHSAFELELTGKTIFIDPWITGNPKVPIKVSEITHGILYALPTTSPVRSYYTTGSLKAVEAVRLINPETVIPMHYQTFPV